MLPVLQPLERRGHPVASAEHWRSMASDATHGDGDDFGDPGNTVSLKHAGEVVSPPVVSTIGCEDRCHNGEVGR